MTDCDRYPYETSDFSDRDCIVFAPHPDDESIGCGGAVIRHAESGSRVTVVFVTSGDRGDFRNLYGDGYLPARRKSAERALSILGVKQSEFWEFPDQGTWAEREAVMRKMSDAILRLRPSVIYAPSPYEAHPDHRTVACAAWRIHRATGIPVLFYELLMALYPNVLIDISGVFERKEAAIRCYETELAYNDYCSKIMGLNRFRTATLPPEIRYAEACVLLDEAHRTSGAVILTEHILTKIGGGRDFFSGIRNVFRKR